MRNAPMQGIENLQKVCYNGDRIGGNCWSGWACVLSDDGRPECAWQEVARDGTVRGLR